MCIYIYLKWTNINIADYISVFSYVSSICHTINHLRVANVSNFTEKWSCHDGKSYSFSLHAIQSTWTEVRFIYRLCLQWLWFWNDKTDRTHIQRKKQVKTMTFFILTKAENLFSTSKWPHAKPKWFKQKYQTEFDSVHLPGQLYKFDKYKICFENEYIDCLLAISLAEVMLLSCDIYSIRQYLCGKGKKVHTFPWKCIFVLQSEDEWALQRFRYHCNHWIPNH